jgi:hypothetical protein
MDVELKAVKEYIKQFKGPNECYKQCKEVTYEALEQIKANIECIQNIFQDPNYLPALYLMGVHIAIDVTMNGDSVIEARFGAVEDESVSASTESTG